jgi:hypothetical protein
MKHATPEYAWMLTMIAIARNMMRIRGRNILRMRFKDWV